MISNSSPGSDGQENNESMNNLLRSELLGYGPAPSSQAGNPSIINSPPGILRYKPKAHELSEVDAMSPVRPGSSPGAHSPHVPVEPAPSVRKIKRLPYKVLDAPALQDDFYLNLVDWSYKNILAVGLGSSVYMWSATTTRVSLHRNAY
jgi:cell division cycle 20-like protein 1 (cofactor of APC complex)